MGMRLSALLATLTLVALLFAGCSADKGGDGTSTSSSSSASKTTSATGSSTSKSSTGTTTSSSTTSTGAAANQAPTGSISAAVNGTNVTFSLTGADADGDDLSWELAFGDSSAKATGNALPTNLTHTYSAGNYTANFTVTDGKEPRSFNVSVAITAGGGGSGAIQSAAVSWNAAFSGCAAEYERIPPAAAAGNAVYGLVEVDAATIGLTYTAVIDWTAGPIALGADVSFYDADGAFVEGNLVDGGPPVTLTGTVPAGAAFAVFTMCDAVAEASATYVVA
jgi:hypothetical protein